MHDVGVTTRRSKRLKGNVEGLDLDVDNSRSQIPVSSTKKTSTSLGLDPAQATLNITCPVTPSKQISSRSGEDGVPSPPPPSQPGNNPPLSTQVPRNVHKLRSKAKQITQKMTATPADYFTLTTTTFKDVSKATNLNFNCDLSGNKTSNIPLETTAMRPDSLQRCLGTSLFGKTCLLFAPVAQTRLMLQFYQSGKLLHKSDLKGCCIIPSKDLAFVQDLLKGWTLAHTLKAKVNTVNKHWHTAVSEETKLGTDLYVFTENTNPDPTLPEAEDIAIQYNLQDKELTMTFDGKASGARAVIGTDTFAGGPGYIHPTFAQKIGCRTRPCNALVVMGDKSTAHCQEECLTHIKLGSFSSKAWLLKLPIPQPYDILLGDVWLKHHKVRILYDKKSLEILTPTRKFTVRSRNARNPVDYAPVHPRTSENHIPDVRILHFMDIKEAINTKQEMHLLFVKKRGPCRSLRG